MAALRLRASPFWRNVCTGAIIFFIYNFLPMQPTLDAVQRTAAIHTTYRLLQCSTCHACWRRTISLLRKESKKIDSKMARHLPILTQGVIPLITRTKSGTRCFCKCACLRAVRHGQVSMRDLISKFNQKEKLIPQTPQMQCLKKEVQMQCVQWK